MRIAVAFDYRSVALSLYRCAYGEICEQSHLAAIERLLLDVRDRSDGIGILFGSLHLIGYVAQEVTLEYYRCVASKTCGKLLLGFVDLFYL